MLLKAHIFVGGTIFFSPLFVRVPLGKWTAWLMAH